MALSIVIRNATKIPGKFSAQYLSACGMLPLKTSTCASFSQSVFKPSYGLEKRSRILSSEMVKITEPQLRCIGTKSDFRLMWTIERFLSVGLVGLIPAAIAYPSPILDNLCAVIVGLHLHWGLEATCQDYVRPIIFGNFIPKLAGAVTYAISIFIIAGLLYFNYNDIGIGKGIRKLWAIKQ